MSSRKMLVRPAGSRKKRPTANSRAKAIVPAQAPPLSSFCSPSLVGRDLGVGGDAERLEADLERLAQGHHAADHRQAQHPVALAPRDERLGGDLDLALGALLRVGAARGQLLGGRLAHRHRPGGDAAHHHALEHRLAADGGVLRGLPRGTRGRAVGGRGSAHFSSSYRRARRYSARAISAAEVLAGELVRVVLLPGLARSARRDRPARRPRSRIPGARTVTVFDPFA